ncbi:MAG: glycoside-pentoside-hexuronide (GPH):cation symporter [Lacrimispora sp.]
MLNNKNVQNAANENERASLFEIFAYGLGGSGRWLFNGIALGLLNYFYTNSLGMSAAVIGSIFMFSRVLDGLIGVSIGILIDKLNPKFGKIKSWLLWSAVPFGLVTLGLFTVPNVSAAGKIIYIIIMYNLMTSVFESTFYIPHLTFPALITSDSGQRTQLSISNQLLGMIISFVPSMILLPAIVAAGNKQSDWIKYMTYIIPIGITFMLVDAFVCKERVHHPSLSNKSKNEPKIGFVKILEAMLQNKYWLMVFGVFIFDALGNQFFNATGIYYAQYVIGDVSQYGKINLASNLPAICALLILSPLVKKFYKRTIFLAGALIKLSGLLMIIILPPTFANLIICRGISAFGMGITFSVMYALVLDTMDYGEWKTGIRLGSTLQSGLNVGMNLGVGLAPGVSGWLMSLGGYNGLVAEQPQAAINSIKLCAIWVPVIFAGLLVLTMVFYDVEKKAAKITEDLQSRNLNVSENA